ncbi:MULTISPECIES: SoxR reducing system RseC family protein [unclassified Lentimicrobium]|uniref:SoxR reducing system RseC family protein n=1 Tax=unclassified Lentimicrobium TaxID=2677434 RepID=UPI0015583415|nr:MULTISPECIES: SoxR reducing system RseC family protein [unclassified Lentimicrobium]NPD44981.1 SoxR reducing system RseC family protein [Lentimicrobium sp. S6]NPD83487.1 SoxR reducing system RseC family protein [Lentimicrobium sp. L6]
MSEKIGDQIQHDGIITLVEPDKLSVSIISMATCASCQVKGACSASDMKEKIVEVKPHTNQDYKVGDKVIIAIDQKVGTWAVLFGYVFPLIIVVVALIIFTNLIEDEGLAGLISIALLAPYYAILYFTRKRMANNFEFKLLK